MRSTSADPSAARLHSVAPPSWVGPCSCRCGPAGAALLLRAAPAGAGRRGAAAEGGLRQALQQVAADRASRALLVLIRRLRSVARPRMGRRAGRGRAVRRRGGWAGRCRRLRRAAGRPSVDATGAAAAVQLRAGGQEAPHLGDAVLHQGCLCIQGLAQLHGRHGVKVPGGRRGAACARGRGARARARGVGVGGHGARGRLPRHPRKRKPRRRACPAVPA